MIRKIIGLLVLAGLVVWGVLSLFQTDEKPLVSDEPSEQEQKVIEESQPEPAFVPESDLENQYPENAEKDA